jgi:predicted HicB family RNase H-like nuclease
MEPFEYYSYSVEWSEEDACFLGRVVEFPSLSGIGDTSEDALREIKFVTSFVIDDLHSQGESVPEPLSLLKYSGRLNLRLPPETHRRLAREAAKNQTSINQLINSKL